MKLEESKDNSALHRHLDDKSIYCTAVRCLSY